MGVFLMANKDSNRTSVSIEEVRAFISNLSNLNDSIKKANAELKSALDGDEKLEELKSAAKAARDALKGYIDSHAVYKEYTAKLEQLKEDKKDLIAEAKTNGIPKKEIDIAIKMLKTDTDPDDTVEIYRQVSDLVE